MNVDIIIDDVIWGVVIFASTVMLGALWYALGAIGREMIRLDKMRPR